MIKIMTLGETPENEIFARSADTLDVSGPVAEIIANVRARGDAALREYCDRFDGGAPERLEVTAGELDGAMAALEPHFLEVMREAAENIRAFHLRQLREGYVTHPREGVTLGERIQPLRRVGLYVPGGTAALPSSVLMSAVPAKLAGVHEIVMVTPARGGVIAPQILAAAKIAGVDRIFKVGGAHAVAALAYGTESIPRVDKIVGPGNAYVAEAKRQVFGAVAIDMIAGPSEILIMADSSADPEFVAADLLSQAEHDRNASAVLVTDCQSLARAVQAEIEVQLPQLPRQEIARAISCRGSCGSWTSISAWTARARDWQSVTSTAEAFLSCSAWLKRSAATNSGSAELSAMIRISLGPAIMSMATAPKTWRLASAT